MPATTIDLFRHADNLVTFARGETVFVAGDPGDLMYVVIEGEVQVQVEGRPVETVGPGGILGELALIDKSPRSATVVARVMSKLAPVDERRFTFLVQQNPYFALLVMRVLAERLRHMNDLVAGRRPQT